MENRFDESISNEDVQKLPQGAFTGEIIVVDQESQITSACKELSSHSIIGFDTETRPTFKPGPLNKVALLQLSTPERCYLFKLSQIPLNRPITKLLESKSILKVGADVKGDINALQELYKFRPRGFVELQSIISQWGVAEKSVRKMAAIVLGYRVSKAQRLSNWESNTLTPAQKTYAATDAWVCTEIFVKLNATQKKDLPKPVPESVAPEGEGVDKKPSRKSSIKRAKRLAEKSNKKLSRRQKPSKQSEQVAQVKSSPHATKNKKDGEKEARPRDRIKRGGAQGEAKARVLGGSNVARAKAKGTTKTGSKRA